MDSKCVGFREIAGLQGDNFADIFLDQLCFTALNSSFFKTNLKSVTGLGAQSCGEILKKGNFSKSILRVASLYRVKLVKLSLHFA